MPLSHFEELGLLSLCGQVDLKFVNFFYGTNPGCWKSRFPYNRLLFSLESDGASTFGDGIRSCRAERGSWFLLPPFQEITHDHNETMLHLSIHFRLTVCGGFELLSGRHAFFCGRDPVLVNGVISEIREKDALRLASGLCAWCWTVLHRVMPQVSSSAVPALYANPAYAELFDFFWKHATAATRVGDMAAFLRMAPESFVKKFTRDTGISPGKFLNRIVAAHAMTMLSGDRRSIKEIAAALEFCNEFYFSRFFRRESGMSPREFRKRFLPAAFPEFPRP